jgi:hypothetical protein
MNFNQRIFESILRVCVPLLTIDSKIDCIQEIVEKNVRTALKAFLPV